MFVSLLLSILLFPPTAAKPSYVYWYSARQQQALTEIQGGPKHIAPHYSVTVNGKKLAYTECRPVAHPNPVGRFRDYKKVATVAGQACAAQW